MAQSEPDLSEFFKLGRNGRRTKPCRVGDFFKTLNKKDAGTLTAALAAERVRPSWIVSWCVRRGAKDIHTTNVVNHRKGVCRCGIVD